VRSEEEEVVEEEEDDDDHDHDHDHDEPGPGKGAGRRMVPGVRLSLGEDTRRWQFYCWEIGRRA
jgi:hypothetical protein